MILRYKQNRLYRVIIILSYLALIFMLISIAMPPLFNSTLDNGYFKAMQSPLSIALLGMIFVSLLFILFVIRMTADLFKYDVVILVSQTKIFDIRTMQRPLSFDQIINLELVANGKLGQSFLVNTKGNVWFRPNYFRLGLGIGSLKPRYLTRFNIDLSYLDVKALEIDRQLNSLLKQRRRSCRAK